MSEIIKKIQESVIAGEDEIIVDLISSALKEGHTPKEIMDNGLTSAMDIVGPKMESGELFITEVLMCSDAMKVGIHYLKPMMKEDEKSIVGKVIIGSVKGDLHDIGKNIVAMMLEISGFEVIDLGIDKSIDAFIEACQKEKPDIIALSALLTTTMVAMKDTTAALKEMNPNVLVVVGGAPVTKEFAAEIKADGYADDAGGSIAVCKNLLMTKV